MTIITSLFRTLTLIALGFAAIVAIFSEIDDASWAQVKIFGVLAAAAFVTLYARWRSVDPWISRYDRWSSKGFEDITE